MQRLENRLDFLLRVLQCGSKQARLALLRHCECHIGERNENLHTESNRLPIPYCVSHTELLAIGRPNTIYESVR